MNIFTPFRSAQERAWSAQPPSPGEIRRRKLVGLAWAAIWSFPLVSLADDVVRATDRPWLAVVVFAAFVGLYLYLVMHGFGSRLPSPLWRTQVLLGIFALLGVVLAVVYTRVSGGGSLVLMLYVGVAGVSIYPPPVAYFWAIGSVVTLGAIGLIQGETPGQIGSLVLSALLAAALVLVIRNMIRLIRELDRTRNELARAAVEQERVRFARDLHDLLGHTLTGIVVRAQLIRKVAPSDPGRAAAEATDVEQLARDALTEVRAAVSGWRHHALDTEIDIARDVLTAAGVELLVHTDTNVSMSPAVEAAVALAVREAVTNVVRHADARVCRIGIVTAGDDLRLTVADDGRGTGAPDGSGLSGMRERIAALGGHVDRRMDGGTTLTITVPAQGVAA
jgi:two-component system, NarL family, sensor histidine kinase DesK